MLPQFRSRHAIRVIAIGLGLISAGAGARCSAAQSKTLDAERIFDSDRLLNIAIDLPSQDWDSLCKQTREFGSAFGNPTEKPFSYFKGNISIDGTRIESVGIRKKGFFGSLDGARPSLKVKLDQSSSQRRIPGVESLTLNNNKQDGSLVSQFLTYQFFQTAKLHAPRCNFARVTVNGQYLGIYSNVESIGKPFLNREFGNSSGNLFEGTLADFHPSAIDRLEAKGTEKENARTRATQLAKLLTGNDELSLSEISEFVDIDYFLRFWAVESLIGFWDGYTSNQNNYWVYENPTNGKFYFVPWGADACFAGFRPPFGFANTQKATCIYADSMLANRIYHAAGGAERYRSTMLEILDSAWNETELLATIDRAEKIIGDDLHERQSFMPRGANAVRNFVRNRRATILKEFEDWPVAVPTKPRKPMYTIDVGRARGRFSTDWQDKAPSNPVESGSATLELDLDGQTVVFDKLGVQGGPNRMPFAVGAFGRSEPQAALVFTGIRSSDSEKVTLNIWLDRAAFGAGVGKSVPIQGMLVVGKGGFNFFNPTANRSLSGELQLSKVGTSDGDPIVGELELKVRETHGGFMDGRNELGVPKSAGKSDGAAASR